MEATDDLIGNKSAKPHQRIYLYVHIGRHFIN